MNTYSKYAPNVFLAKCEERYAKGDEAILTTKYGKENEVIIYNLIFEKDGYFYYSFVRADGFNSQVRAQNKAEKYESWAASADKKSNEYYKASQEGKDFLVLGEPIKIGHHSEKRHRALIDRNWARMGKSVEMSEKAKNHENKAEYWAKMANKIDLSMPESVEYFEYKLEQKKAIHEDLKAHPEKRAHSMSLQYAKKDVNEAEKNLNLAKKLWL